MVTSMRVTNELFIISRELRMRNLLAHNYAFTELRENKATSCNVLCCTPSCFLWMLYYLFIWQSFSENAWRSACGTNRTVLLDLPRMRGIACRVRVSVRKGSNACVTRAMRETWQACTVIREHHPTVAWKLVSVFFPVYLKSGGPLTPSK